MLLSEQPIYSDMYILLLQNGLQWTPNSVLQAYIRALQQGQPHFHYFITNRKYSRFKLLIPGFPLPFWREKKIVMLDAMNVSVWYNLFIPKDLSCKNRKKYHNEKQSVNNQIYVKTDKF